MTNEMTAEEAIRWLDAIKKYYIHGGDEAYDKKRMKAIDKAIKVLEAQPCEDCISRKEIKEFINTMLTSNEEMGSISTNEGRWVEEKTYLYGVEILEGLSEYVNDLPSVKPKYTDEEIDKAQAVEQAYVDKMVELAVEEAKRPKGKWIEVEVRNVYATLKCSVCGRVIEPIFDFCKYSYEDIKTFYPYCHCGAEMSGGADE